MTWYLLRTGMNAKDMFGEVAYVELEGDVREDEARERTKEAYPKFQTGTYVKSFSEMDWDVDSSSFDDKEAFLEALDEVVGTSSNAAYSQEFGRVSTKPSRRD